MKKFKLKTGEEFELTNKNFENKTGKQFPYYQLKTLSGKFIAHGSEEERTALSNKRYKMSYYALCPGCGLPIQCRCMFQRIIKEQNKKSIGEHAMHINNVPGLGSYKEEDFKKKYKNCPYKSPRRYDIFERKDVRSKEVQELLKLLLDNYDRVIESLAHSIGFDISDNLAKEMLRDCFSTQQFAYREANKFNLPWTFALTTKSYSLWGRKIRASSETSTDIFAQLKAMDPELCIEKGQIKCKGNAWYTFAFCGHVSRPKPSKFDYVQFIKMKIWRDDKELGVINVPVEESLFLDNLKKDEEKISRPQLLEFAKTFNH